MNEQKDKTVEKLSQATGRDILVARTLLEHELASALGIPLSAVKSLRYAQKIPYVPISKTRIIYLAESIVEWLRSREIKPVTDTPDA